MSKIRGKNTKIEVLFRKALSAEIYPKGFRYRLYCRNVVGRPDVVFVGLKIAVFIDGDFWHGRGCRREGWKPTKTRKKFWRDKIEGNVRRDRKVDRLLRKDGWRVVRFWESDARKNIEKCVGKVSALLSDRSK